MSNSADKSALPYRPCVGIMLLNRGGLIWAGRRADAQKEAEGFGSWWQMPQGGIDAGEDPAKAAHRELHEETGIRSAEIIQESPGWHHYDLPGELIGVAWGGRYRGQKQKWFAMRFLGSDSEVNIRPPEGLEAEFDTWAWVSAAELLDLIVPFKRPVYEVVLGEFAALTRP